MINKIIKRALIGFIIGMAVGDIITIVMSHLSGRATIAGPDMIARFGSEPMAILIQTILSGIHGAICMAGTIFYEMEDWSLLKTALVHYLLIICSFTTIGLYLNWISFSFADIAVSWIGMGIGYLIVWLIMYFRYKAEVKELNEILDKDKEEK